MPTADKSQNRLLQRRRDVTVANFRIYNPSIPLQSPPTAGVTPVSLNYCRSYSKAIFSFPTRSIYHYRLGRRNDTRYMEFWSTNTLLCGDRAKDIDNYRNS